MDKTLPPTTTSPSQPAKVTLDKSINGTAALKSSDVIVPLTSKILFLSETENRDVESSVDVKSTV